MKVAFQSHVHKSSLEVKWWGKKRLRVGEFTGEINHTLIR